jgi:hypothetical protein
LGTGNSAIDVVVVVVGGVREVVVLVACGPGRRVEMLIAATPRRKNTAGKDVS